MLHMHSTGSFYDIMMGHSDLELRAPTTQSAYEFHKVCQVTTMILCTHWADLEGPGHPQCNQVWLHIHPEWRERQ